MEQGGLLRSDDSGQTWQLVQGSSGAPRTPDSETMVHPDVHSVATHPSTPELVFAATGGGLYRSENGGAHWTRLYRCYCRAVWVDPADPNHLIFGPADSVDRNGRVAESIDGGQNWQTHAEGLELPWPQHMVERLTAVSDHLLAVLSNGHLFMKPLKTDQWQRILPDMPDVTAVTSMTAASR